MGKTAIQYALMEIHYSNPNGLSNVVDQSGFFLTYTTTIRPINVGTMALGISTLENINIPPGLSNYTAVSECSSICTSYLPENGIEIFL